MTPEPFNDGWTFRRADDTESVAVTLPHDAMIHEARTPQGGTSHHGGFFPGGTYLYTKTWDVPKRESGGMLRLVFEGVYGDTTVRLNGVTVATNRSGYREFAVELESALVVGANVLEVEVDNSQTPNSRWYTGSGIYRRVWLEDLEATRIADGGIRLHTRCVGVDAAVDATILVDGDARDLVARVTLADGPRVVAEASAPVEAGAASLEVLVGHARAWSHDDPYLYSVSVEVTRGTTVVDERELSFGLRTIVIDAAHGLRVNGEAVLLKGAAVHHDNGLLGAATLRAAEFRRARILKANGFNAIRSAHQPISRDLLDAADQVGLYVIDELADTWYQRKTPHDAAPLWEESWREDARSMVDKARNHPSVIMYSIGNEVGETATAKGVETARELNAFFHDLDPARPTTLAMNFLVNVMSSRGTDLFKANQQGAERPAPRKKSAASSTMANIMMNRIGSIMQTVSKLPVADRVTRDAIPEVDVIGYNYAWGRYRGDTKKYPERVIYGSETLMGDVVKAWSFVEGSPNVIGDFVWSGWDYLGETGLGTWTYGDGDVLLSKAYPHVLAGCGVIDILGNPGAPALHLRALWRDLSAPGIAVRPLDHAGESTHRVAWRSTDAISSWAWRGSEGKRAEIEVYSSDDEVELLLNGVSLGRRRAGRARGFLARFRARYEPGTLEAIGYREGREVSRSTLRSAENPRLTLGPESLELAADGQDLAFVSIDLADEFGVVEMLDGDEVTVTVTGAGTLAGLGSASPTTELSFTGSTTPLYYGRALAIIRSTGAPGPVTITATSAAHGSATVSLAAVPALRRVVF